jgi:hypothetical protein
MKTNDTVISITPKGNSHVLEIPNTEISKISDLCSLLSDLGPHELQKMTAIICSGLNSDAENIRESSSLYEPADYLTAISTLSQIVLGIGKFSESETASNLFNALYKIG